jgi:FxsC-like protein
LIGTDDVRAPYFFLSYARSDPLAGNPDEDPDMLVETFYSDLTQAVRHLASDDEASGFYDHDVPIGSDWKQFTTRALCAAQVFVPLYSVSYLTNSWPGRELTCFKKRIEQAGRLNPVRRFVPVLWAPLAGVQEPPGLRDALTWADSVPDYAENGLRRLMKPQFYHDSYQSVLNWLAQQIVELAERDPIEPVEPSKVGDIEKAPSAFPVTRSQPVFNIEVFAPTTVSAPHSRNLRAYGETPALWRPFPGQELPLAEYARQLIERFDFDVRVGAAAIGPAARRPGLIVIDPAFITDQAGRDALRTVADVLPRWVLPLVVVAPDDEPTRKLAAVVLDILAKAKVLPTERSGQAARGVSSLDQFVSIVPVLVAEAERHYFRYRSSRTSLPRGTDWRTLTQPEGPEAPAAASDP